MTTPRGRVLSIPEAAAYTSLSVKTMQKLAMECGPDLPVVHLTPGPRGRRGFRLSDLDRFLDARTVGRVSA